MNFALWEIDECYCLIKHVCVILDELCMMILDDGCVHTQLFSMTHYDDKV